MRKKTIIFSFISVIVLTGGYFGYKEYTRKKTDLSHVKAGLSIQSSDLIKEFESDEDAANKKYLPKEDFIIEVTGTIKDIRKDDKGRYTVVLQGDAGTLSSVQCAVDSTHNDAIQALQKGTTVSMKGVVTGFNADELLGSDVFLSRSVIAKD